MPVGNGDAFDQATAKPYRVLAKLYPQDKAHFGNGGSNNSSLRSAGLRLREAVNQIGYKTVDYQEQPPLVPNWRPYVEEAKLAGVKAFQQLSAQDLTPLLTAANNVGWSSIGCWCLRSSMTPRPLRRRAVEDVPVAAAQGPMILQRRHRHTWRRPQKGDPHEVRDHRVR
jgi:hypothetical protein